MEIALILAVVLGALVLFITERFRADLVALLALATLLLIGQAGMWVGLVRPDRWVSIPETLSGLNNPAVITVAAMFVLSAGLEKTGALAGLGRILTRLGRSQAVLLIAVMLIAGIASAFVNNTAAVAVFLPVVLTVCTRRRISPSRILIPLSFASQFGGVCTLIGTSTNLLVSSISQEAGRGAFGMFEFTALGSLMMGTGMLYMLLIGRWALPARRGDELTEAYRLREYVTEVRVLTDSPLVGKTVGESRLGETHDVTVLEILRDQKRIWSPHAQPLQAGDILVVRGNVKSLMDVRSRTGLEIEPEFKLKDETLEGQEMTLVEALVAPRSRLVGRTLTEVDFRNNYHAIVLAVQRAGHIIRDKIARLPLRLGDALLVLLRKSNVNRLRASENLIVLAEVEAQLPSSRRNLVTLVIVGLVVALAALNVLPIVISALLGSLAMVFARCLRLEQAYDAIDWQVIFLLAGVFPIGIALQRSGASQILSDQLLRIVGGLGPIAVLAAFYLLTAALTELMSNAAAAVLIAPLAISAADALGVSSRPLLMAVAFAASTSFATPVGYQTNTMVYGPGGYRFTDFTKVGVPLNLLFWGLGVWLIPKFWPF